MEQQINLAVQPYLPFKISYIQVVEPGKDGQF